MNWQPWIKELREQVSPAYALATTLEQLHPTVFKNQIKKLRGWTARKIHIYTQRYVFWQNRHYYRAECYRRYGTNCLRHKKVWGQLVFADQIDHVISLYNGGYTDDDNHQPLCGPCNRWKGTQNIDYR